jgi:two-component system response regulator FixJ
MQPNPPLVCVVDDDAGVRNALKFSLEVEGLAVRLYDGAVSLLGDPGLPSCRCPVIMITGQATRDLKSRAEKLGVRRVIEKPSLDAELLVAVQAAIAGEPLS